MKNLIGIDELRPIVNKLNAEQITYGKACELITEAVKRNNSAHSEAQAVRQNEQAKEVCPMCKSDNVFETEPWLNCTDCGNGWIG